MNATDILAKTKTHVSTYLLKDDLPLIVAVADPSKIRMGVSLQRNFPLTLIERSYGIPFGRFRSDAVRLVSDPEELHGYKWSVETHEAVFEADAATEEHLRVGRHRPVPIELSTGLGNVLQNVRSLAYIDRTAYMVVGERPDHPPPYACLVQYTAESKNSHPVGVELLLFNEVGGCQQIDKKDYIAYPVKATMAAKPKFEERLRWAVSGYPLVLSGQEVSLEMTTRNVSDYRHIWRLPKLQTALVQHLTPISRIPEAANTIEFYFGFDEIRERRTFVLATRGDVIAFPMELPMTQEWIETMCNVCQISEDDLQDLPQFNKERYAIIFDPDELKEDFRNTDYIEKNERNQVNEPGDFFIDNSRQEIVVRLLPAIYPHHVVGVGENGEIVNISVCGQSGRSGITIRDAKKLCREVGLTDALIFDNGNDVFARLRGGHVISHRKNIRKTRLTAALHFAFLLDPGPSGGFELVSDNHEVTKSPQSPAMIAHTPGSASKTIRSPHRRQRR
jgi:hypothetical protein